MAGGGFPWVIGPLPSGLFGNCGKPETVLQSEPLVDSESKDPLVIKLSAFTSSEKGRQELGSINTPGTVVLFRLES